MFPPILTVLTRDYHRGREHPQTVWVGLGFLDEKNPKPPNPQNPKTPKLPKPLQKQAGENAHPSCRDDEGAEGHGAQVVAEDGVQGPADGICGGGLVV